MAEEVAGGMVTVTATLDNAVQGGFTVMASTADGTATAGERLHHDHHDADIHRDGGRDTGNHGADPQRRGCRGG